MSTSLVGPKLKRTEKSISNQTPQTSWLGIFKEIAYSFHSEELWNETPLQIQKIITYKISEYKFFQSS